MTKELAEGMRELDRLLRSHDWFYAFASDDSTYQAGLAAWRHIQAVADSLGRDGKRLLQAHLDVHFHPGNGLPFVDYYQRVSKLEHVGEVSLIAGQPGAKTLHIVSTDDQARAVRYLAEHRRVPEPTILVTGGADRLEWLDDRHLKKVVREAERVVVHGSWQTTPDAQIWADQGYADQVDAVRQLRKDKPPETVIEWRPRVEVAADITGFCVVEMRRDQALAQAAKGSQSQQSQQPPEQQHAAKAVLSR